MPCLPHIWYSCYFTQYRFNPTLNQKGGLFAHAIFPASLKARGAILVQGVGRGHLETVEMEN